MERLFLLCEVSSACHKQSGQVRNGINGYTTPVGDAEAFAEAMLKATKIKKLAKFHDVNNSEQQIIDFFNSI